MTWVLMTVGCNNAWNRLLKIHSCATLFDNIRRVFYLSWVLTSLLPRQSRTAVLCHPARGHTLRCNETCLALINTSHTAILQHTGINGAEGRQQTAHKALPNRQTHTWSQTSLSAPLDWPERIRCSVVGDAEPAVPRPHPATGHIRCGEWDGG